MAAARTSSNMLHLALVALALCGTFVAFGRCQVNSGLSQPEKPTTAYFLFLRENRARIAKNLGKGHSMVDFVMEADQEWQALSAKTKTDWANWRVAFEAIYAIYQVEPEEFFAKKVKDPNAPKRPLSGFTLWM